MPVTLSMVCARMGMTAALHCQNTGMSLYEQAPTFSENMRGRIWETTIHGIDMTKLHTFSCLDSSLSKVCWSCLSSMQRHYPKGTRLNPLDVCHLRCLPSTESMTICHAVLLPIHLLNTSCICVLKFGVLMQKYATLTFTVIYSIS